MGSGSRPATCVSCGKRLSRKQWYYRNGKFFCKKRCFEDEQAKAQGANAETAQVKDVQVKEPAKKTAAGASVASEPAAPG